MCTHHVMKVKNVFCCKNSCHRKIPVLQCFIIIVCNVHMQVKHNDTIKVSFSTKQLITIDLITFQSMCKIFSGRKHFKYYSNTNVAESTPHMSLLTPITLSTLQSWMYNFLTWPCQFYQNNRCTSMMDTNENTSLLCAGKYYKIMFLFLINFRNITNASLTTGISNSP